MQQSSEPGPKGESGGTGHAMLCRDFVPWCTSSFLSMQKHHSPPRSFLALSTAAENKATIIHIQSSPSETVMSTHPCLSSSPSHGVITTHQHGTSRQEPAHAQEPCQNGCLLKGALGSTREEPRRSHIKAAEERAPCPPAGSFPLKELGSIQA